MCTSVSNCFHHSKIIPSPCLKNGQCLISGKNHRFCTSCTLSRCLAIGMSDRLPGNKTMEREFSSYIFNSTLKGSSTQSNYAVNSAQENNLKKKAANDCYESSRKKSKDGNGKPKATKCDVCDDDDGPIGAHYGAFTCDPCRRFFSEANRPRRIIKPCKRSKNNQKCLNKRVSIRPCTYCRLSKCLEVGMRYKRLGTARSKQKSEVPPQNLSQGDSDNISPPQNLSQGDSDDISPPQDLLPDENSLVSTSPSLAISKPTDIFLSDDDRLHWGNIFAAYFEI